MDDFIKNLVAMRRALEHHNMTCRVPARSFLLAPADYGRLGVAQLWGVPVCADDRIAGGRFRVDCSGSAWELEDELHAYIETN